MREVKDDINSYQQESLAKALLISQFFVSRTLVHNFGPCLNQNFFFILQNWIVLSRKVIIFGKKLL